MTEARSTAQRRARHLAAQAFIDAHPRGVRAESLEPVCTCSHGCSAHHGPNGELHCGEDGCDCAAFTRAAA